ncbi:hypothetical protein BpHYR1_030676 [Brachionus plicatilis]|uniref:Uncharacterized protein n=1 Tax=Brachionus plicatilis TaxID=10195 RepID=A0A3M7R7G8_BRAPC|nr:hypothetical protein BpHYR1_030676 [Brachionus plicatilis]
MIWNNNLIYNKLPFFVRGKLNFFHLVIGSFNQRSGQSSFILSYNFKRIIKKFSSVYALFFCRSDN